MQGVLVTPLIELLVKLWLTFTMLQVDGSFGRIICGRFLPYKWIGGKTQEK